jgi:arsenite oxidase small subunit
MTLSKETVPSRRRFLMRLVVTLSTISVISVLARLLEPLGQTPQASTPAQSFPRLKVGNLSDLKANVPVSFNYPLKEQPNYLVKLGVKVKDGVGPDEDIIAYSAICQHLGCIYSFVAVGDHPQCRPSASFDVPVGYCCCHGTEYDYADDAKVLGGPAPRPVPRVILEAEPSTGDIYAVGMTPPVIYGYGPPGSTDVSLDLKGGTLVA